ncbi:hypothetical protein DFS34DRAFT_630039 [Phlyctochytrium arcticum]|nr:hypothetical protein DFS34DRAFT_638579 [Phlyctochytrium arcticum]KAI9094148.1 hypothetical protein DFS34DRAFT_630039 [Phlyctochytrium arcticum]
MSGIRFEPPRNIREFQRPPQGTDSVPPPMVETLQTVIRQDNETGQTFASDAAGTLNPNPIRIDRERERVVELPGGFPRIPSPEPVPIPSPIEPEPEPPSPIPGPVPPIIIVDPVHVEPNRTEIVPNYLSPFVDRPNRTPNRVNPVPPRRPRRLVPMTPAVVVRPGVEEVVRPSVEEVVRPREITITPAPAPAPPRIVEVDTVENEVVPAPVAPAPTPSSTLRPITELRRQPGEPTGTAILNPGRALRQQEQYNRDQMAPTPKRRKKNTRLEPPGFVNIERTPSARPAEFSQPFQFNPRPVVVVPPAPTVVSTRRIAPVRRNPGEPTGTAILNPRRAARQQEQYDRDLIAPAAAKRQRRR